MNAQGDDSPSPPARHELPQSDSSWTTPLFPPFGPLMDWLVTDRSGASSTFETVCQCKIRTSVRIVDSSKSKEDGWKSSSRVDGNEFACRHAEETAFSLGWHPSHALLAAVIQIWLRE